tara:strand:- start:686 stop:1117 length:432 start_codon:yes stop_codon:yes gene_type:complete
MKRNELKKVLKPLIKECIKEVLFEEGVLSGIISEVVRGAGTSQAIPVDNRTLRKKQEKQASLLEEERAQTRWKTDMEARKRLLDATGINSVDVFEGTTPLTEGAAPSAQGPLAGVAPEDAGIDISGIMDVGSSRNWSRLAKGK